MSVHVSAQHKALVVPAEPALCAIFPHAKPVTLRGKNYLAVPHGLDETLFLRNVGFDVPAPVLTQYDWEGGSPFDVQKKTVALLTTSRRAYVLNGLGTGKTRSALYAWRYLNKIGAAGKLLVVAPLSTLNFTWAKEVFEAFPGVRCAVLYGSREKRLKLLRDPAMDVFVINHDGLNTVREELETRTDIDTLVLDELAVYRNGTAARTKAIRKFAAKMRWVWGMTGSPTPNEPTDAWAQATIITPHTVPKYYTHFRDQVMNKVSQFKWVPKPDAIEQAYRAMQPAVRFTLDDIVELPELVERTVDIDMGPKQAKVYSTMKQSAYAAIQNEEITAMNAGAVLNKLLQISAGWVYSNERGVVSLDNDNRLQRLVDDIGGTQRKVLVFVPFVHALEGIKARLTSEGIDVRTVSGATPQGERSETFNLFQNTTSVRVLVAHPQTMAHGLTLTAADTIIWFGPTTSLEIFEQANGRIRRYGQKFKQLVLMYQATDAERKIYARLRAKQKVQNALLDLFEENS